MDYSMVPSTTLYANLQSNMAAVAGAVTVMVGEHGTFPDPREMAQMIQEIEFDDFMAAIHASKNDSTIMHMDIQAQLAEITLENVQILQELHRRV